MDKMSLPAHWKVVRLGDYIFKPEYGYTASATHDSIGTKFLRITDIQDDDVNWADVPNCECDEDTKKKFLLVPGDVVIARIGATTGKAFLVDDCPESIFASYLIRVKTKPPLLSQFLSTCFRTENYWRQIRQNKGGRLKGGVNIPILQNLKFPLPPLPEQRAIAHVLQTIQLAKAARLREIELERERKAALVDYLFSHGTNGEPRKQTEIGEIPESWEVTRLGDIVKLKSGSSRPKDMKSEPDSKLTVPVYGGNGVLGYTSKEFSQQKHLVIGRVGAYCGCVHVAEIPNWITDNALYSESWFDSEVSLNFLAEQLRYFNLNRLQRKGGQPLVTQSIIHGLNIPLPLPFEQHEIAQILQSCDTKIAALEQEAARLDELFHAMLDELMTGKRSAVPLIDAE